MIANPGTEGRISFSEDGGLLDVRDPGLFRPGREEFCRRLAAAVAQQGVARSAYVSLASGSCRIDFEPGRLGHAEMASRFADAVRAAIEEDPKSRPSDLDDRDWTSIASFAGDGSPSTWETTGEGRGSLRLRNRALARDRGLTRQVARELAHTPGIVSCRVTFWRRELDLRFDPGQITPVAALSAAEGVYRKALRPDAEPAHGWEGQAPPVAKGLRRLWYLTLAGGSFGLTVVGLIVPGIPTVPFLLATSYYLVRSSPTLNGILLRSRFLGPILADLETGGGLRRINKIKLIGFTFIVGLVTVVLAGPSLVLPLPMAAATAVSLFAITRIPEIADRSKLNQRPRVVPA